MYRYRVFNEFCLDFQKDALISCSSESCGTHFLMYGCYFDVNAGISVLYYSWDFKTQLCK